jgi:RecJ-like exonuclease
MTSIERWAYVLHVPTTTFYDPSFWDDFYRWEREFWEDVDSMSKECDYCRGNGIVGVSDPKTCPVCKGMGRVNVEYDEYDDTDGYDDDYYDWDNENGHPDDDVIDVGEGD